MHLELAKMAKQFNNKVYTLQLPDQNIVVVNSAATAREALLTKRDDFAGRPYLFISDYIAKGSRDIACADFHPTLILQRKILHSAIRLYHPFLEEKINDEINELFKRLNAQEGEPIEPTFEIALTTLNVICAMVYGERYDIDDQEFKTIFDYNEKMFCLLGSLNIINIFPFLIHFPIKDSRILKYIRDTRDELLGRKYQEHQETYQDGKIRDLTDALIKSLKEAQREDCKTFDVITEDHVIMTMADAFSAGFETTSTTIRWFLLLMIRYPDIQKKVQEELKAVVEKGQLPRWEDRNKCPFTMATIEETLRISVPGPLLLPHKATKDSTLEGYTIPKDTTIFINVWNLHFDEKEWEDPYRFNPERFIDSEGKLMQVAYVKSYLPFGAGRRVCVGETLAKHELFIILTRLLQQYEIVPEQGVPAPSLIGDFQGVIHRPKPFRVCFNKRFQ